MRGRTVISAIGVAAVLLLGAAQAHADPSSSSASPSELRGYGALALVGGSAATAAGGWLLLEGLKPCPAYHDCSTRGLGVVFAAPLLIPGLGLLGVGVYFFQKAARVEEERRGAAITFAPLLAPTMAGGAVTAKF